MYFRNRRHKFWFVLLVVLSSILALVLWAVLTAVGNKAAFYIYRCLGFGEITITLINLLLGVLFLYVIFKYVKKNY